MVAELRTTSILARRQMALVLSQPAGLEQRRSRPPDTAGRGEAEGSCGGGRRVALRATPTGRAWGETFLSQFRAERFIW